MNACKSFFRTSISCLDHKVLPKDRPIFSHHPFLFPPSGFNLKPYIKPHSKPYSSVQASIQSDPPDKNPTCTVPFQLVHDEEEVVECIDTVEELLLNEDDASRQMKMERRSDFDFDPFRTRTKRWFPYLDRYNTGTASLTSEEVLEALDPYILDTRKERFKKLVVNRSYSVCLVVEGLSDFGNVSAVFRSADALGIQSVHVISRDSTKRYRNNRHVSMGAEKWLDIELWSSPKECFEVLRSRGYRVATTHVGIDAIPSFCSDFRRLFLTELSGAYRNNRLVSMGAEKWLDIELWSSPKECFEALRWRGYRVATTHVGIEAVSVHDMDWSCPTAIVVGNEHRGISDEALGLSDMHCSIPMNGMVESFNVSVAAGILMHHAVWYRTSRLGCHGDLTSEERHILLAEFSLRHKKSAISVVNEYAKRKIPSTTAKL